jgi:hypothetical protein
LLCNGIFGVDFVVVVVVVVVYVCNCVVFVDFVVFCLFVCLLLCLFLVVKTHPGATYLPSILFHANFIANTMLIKFLPTCQSLTNHYGLPTMRCLHMSAIVCCIVFNLFCTALAHF